MLKMLFLYYFEFGLIFSQLSICFNDSRTRGMCRRFPTSRSLGSKTFLTSSTRQPKLFTSIRKNFFRRKISWLNSNNFCRFLFLYSNYFNEIYYTKLVFFTTLLFASYFDSIFFFFFPPLVHNVILAEDKKSVLASRFFLQVPSSLRYSFSVMFDSFGG